jgi:secreted trypsin-like serine protease
MKCAAILLAATAAVAQGIKIKPLILGGTVVPDGMKTYAVNLHNETHAFKCDGSLITPTHVLTAGHCLGKSKYVWVGSHFINGSSDGDRIEIKKETRHPKYDQDSLTFDYGVIELASPSKFPPVKLYSVDSEKFVGATATAMGWGRVAEGGPLSNELLRVDVAVLSDAQCKTALADITESMMCAGGVKNKDACNGDSGGPLILEQSSGDLLIGIVSWGDGCGRANTPGVYSKVSLEKAWIQSLAPGSTWVDV